MAIGDAQARRGLQAPAVHDCAQLRTTPHNTSITADVGRPGSCTIDHGPADQLGRPAVHVENPADTLDRHSAHNTRHDRQHAKQKMGMHARGVCMHPRPTAADCHHPPGEPPTPRPGVYPPPWGNENFDDRISKASCYVVPLTFFFEISRRDPVAAAMQKKCFDNCQRKFQKNSCQISNISDWIFTDRRVIISQCSPSPRRKVPPCPAHRPMNCSSSSREE